MQPPWPADRLRLRRRLGGPGTPRRRPPPPPPRTHRPLKPPSFRFSRRRAPGARPRSPLPRRRSSHSSRRTSRAALGPRSTRTATVLEGGGLPHAPTAAGSGAHDGPPAHCARVPAPPQPPRRRPRFRSGHSQPAGGGLQVPAGTARTPGGVVGRAPGVSWVPRGGARAELWALALRCILGSVVLEERGAWLASGAQGSRVTAEKFQAQGSLKIGFIRGRQFVCKQSHKSVREM